MSANTQSGAGSTGWTPANAAPLGLGAFGVTTLYLSLVNANLINSADLTGVIVVAFAYGGIVQLLAGMWEFRAGNTFGAVAFSTYGGFWISVFLLVQLEAGGLIKAGAFPSAFGAYLWCWTAITVGLTLCTFASARALSLLFIVLSITFILLAIGNSGSSTNTIHIGGYFGIATAALAIYIAIAEVMKAVYGRWVLPIGAPAE
ncbi:MAG: acetate uptake transporter [Solirubrobacteraceae bacterium]|jgi:succinate-acetate transporter protein